MASKRVEALLARKPALVEVESRYPGALDAFLAVPADARRYDCWLQALMVLLDTGNLVEAIKSLISCLTATLGQADVFGCLVKAVLGFITGKPLEEVIVAFIQCLLGTAPVPPGPPGELRPPNLDPVERCS